MRKSSYIHVDLEIQKKNIGFCHFLNVYYKNSYIESSEDVFFWGDAHFMVSSYH